MPEVAKKKRIFQIAKELNISHMEIIQFLKNNGTVVESHMAPVTPEAYDEILLEFSKDKLQIERHRKEQARKIVVSKIHKKEVEDPQASITSEKPAVRKLKTSLKEEKLALSEKLKDASDKLTKEKKKADTNKDVAEAKKETKKTDLEANGVAAPKAKLDSVKPRKIKGETVKLTQLETPAVVPAAPRKLKKISIQDIADKINQTKKRTPKGKGESSKPQIKQPLPQFGKSGAKKKSKKKDKNVDVESSDIKKSIKVPEFTTVDELAQSMDVTVQEVIMACMGLGMMVTINQRMDMDNIVLIADEFGFEVETVTEFAEEKTSQAITEEDIKNAVERAPVVTIMGHVDHGKTSLLDHIRDENVVAGESGGITQHIGAYEVQLDSGKKITFLDTPGHAAFTAMRARGAQVTDIVIVIIAADDDVMPQTKEAIDHAKAAEVPIIIAINKVDVPNANPDKIRKSLGELNILVEEWGGKYQCQEISAKKGQGIDELLDKILLEAEVLELKANQKTEAKGIVIESRLDKGLGAVATVVINKGTLNKGEAFVCGNQFGKVRAMMNERSQKLIKAFPSDPVQILGFDDVPKAGDAFTVFKDEREAKKIATERAQLSREAEHRRFRKITLDQIGKKISSGEVQELDIIIKGDVDGSIEAVSDSLMELSTDEVSVKIIHRSVGMITESDVSLAAASSAIIIAFNVKSSPEAKAMAKSIGVDIRNYSIIYEAIQEVKLALEGLLEPEEVEKALGYADVREKFKIPKLGIIAGCYIKEGRVVRNALLRVKRDGETLHTGKLTSLKRFKDDVADVTEGYECGIGVDGFKDFNEGDVIEVYEIKEVKRSLA
ncbi:MAG: translation initiation factor IF-2 [Candidatus Marinimicrobia bacterium]|jgi:translation initiation factor IF-2|nr:translation initiation factor IF-2 [Candidatus Neomarinimicrobiota bacterium]